MTTPHETPVVRRVTRVLALVPAALLLTGAGPALAAPPEQWEQAPAVDPLSFLMLLLVIPVGLGLVIALLVAIPGMRKSEAAYHPGLAWRHEPEWFGGPRDGLAKADKTDPEAIEASGERGGARGQW